MVLEHRIIFPVPNNVLNKIWYKCNFEKFHCQKSGVVQGSAFALKRREILQGITITWLKIVPHYVRMLCVAGIVKYKTCPGI